MVTSQFHLWKKIPMVFYILFQLFLWFIISDIIGEISRTLRIGRERGQISIRYRSSDLNVPLGRSSNRAESSAEKAYFFSWKPQFLILININGSPTNNGRLWYHLRSISIDFGKNWKLSLKIAARAVLLRAIYGLLIFELFDKNGMRSKQRKFRTRKAINICYPNFRSAWESALKKFEFFFQNWIGTIFFELSG